MLTTVLSHVNEAISNFCSIEGTFDNGVRSSYKCVNRTVGGLPRINSQQTYSFCSLYSVCDGIDGLVNNFVNFNSFSIAFQNCGDFFCTSLFRPSEKLGTHSIKRLSILNFEKRSFTAQNFQIIKKKLYDCYL